MRAEKKYLQLIRINKIVVGQTAMTELESGEIRDKLIVCKVCCESIQDGARKCIHCDSFQDWRRFLNMSGTVLALLVALITVSSTALPQMIALLTPSFSEVSVVQRGFKGNQLAFHMVNSGTAEASFISARLEGTLDEEIQEVDLEELGAGFPILPAVPRPLWVHIPIVEVEKYLEWPIDQNSIVIVVVRIQEFGGEVKNHRFELNTRSQSRLQAATLVNYNEYLRGSRREPAR